MKMFKKENILLPVGVLLLALGMTGCGQAEGEEDAEVVIQQVVVSDSNPLVADQVSQVTYGDVIKRDLYDGVVTPYVEELYFAESGTFLEYTVAMGDTVEKGDIIARTDVSSVKQQVENLEEQIASLTDQYEYQMATLKNKEAILNEEMAINYEALEEMTYLTQEYTSTCQALGRQEKSLKSNQMQQRHLTEEYELELPYLQEQLTELKKQLTNNVIKAPFDGTIVQLQTVAGGDRISTETPYVAIADTSRYLVVGSYVRVGIIEKAVRVYVFINGKEYEAEYIPMDSAEYSKILNNGGTAYSFYEITCDGSFDFGQAAVIAVVNETAENVLVVPQTAVQQEGSRRYCYVKRGEDREKVFIETGVYDGMYYEVESGLEEGDEVFIE